MLDYNLPFHILKIDENDCCHPQLSFAKFSEAKEFIKFTQQKNLVVVKTKELKNYINDLEYKNKKPGINQPG